MIVADCDQADSETIPSIARTSPSATVSRAGPSRRSPRLILDFRIPAPPGSGRPTSKANPGTPCILLQTVLSAPMNSQDNRILPPRPEFLEIAILPKILLIFRRPSPLRRGRHSENRVWNAGLAPVATARGRLALRGATLSYFNSSLLVAARFHQSGVGVIWTLTVETRREAAWEAGSTSTAVIS